MSTELTVIPGVGKNMRGHLERLGITCVEDLAGCDPEALYVREQALFGPLDRCVLYVYRLAVYYAEHDTYEPEKLRWWYWKDENLDK